MAPLFISPPLVPRRWGCALCGAGGVYVAVDVRRGGDVAVAEPPPNRLWFPTMRNKTHRWVATPQYHKCREKSRKQIVKG